METKLNIFVWNLTEMWNSIKNTAHCTNRAGNPVFIGLLRSAVLSRHCTNTALTLHRHCLQGNALQLQQYNKSVPILKKLTYSCPIILRSSFAYYWAFAPDLLQIPHVFAHDLRQKPKNIRNYWLSLLIRLTTTFTITSFSSVRRLSSMSKQLFDIQQKSPYRDCRKVLVGYCHPLLYREQ